jgi:hypothetical protein
MYHVHIFIAAARKPERKILSDQPKTARGEADEARQENQSTNI